MLAVQLTVFVLLFCGVCGSSRHLFDFHCNPPQMMVGKFCAIVLDNNYNADNNITIRDIHYDSLFYDYDDDLCAIQKWEFVKKWTCRLGFSEKFAQFMFSRSYRNKDGAVTGGDFSAPFSSPSDFLLFNFNLYKNLYCSDPKNRENPVDRVQCAEVDELEEEDIKCP
ncbi:uncharacterized protein [Haliotis asinina]|uniref:uncharacterized protein n=1 Tax=Haliotis asinina TaxID=109174 RepID=UPI0035322CA2